MAMDNHNNKAPAGRPKSKILKFLPKAAPSAITFHNHPPFSPGRSEYLAGTKLKPPRAHRRNQPQNSGDYENQEPTSPKISCMGQIKCKNKKDLKSAIDKSAAASHKPNVIKRIFGGGGGGGTKPSFRKSKSDLSGGVSSSGGNRAPTLNQMQRFSSGRESLVGFDWTVHLAPEKVENRRRKFDYYEEDEEDGEPVIPFSGGGGFCLEPRKEINLWKRRTLVQPRPLQLNTIG